MYSFVCVLRRWIGFFLLYQQVLCFSEAPLCGRGLPRGEGCLRACTCVRLCKCECVSCRGTWDELLAVFAATVFASTSSSYSFSPLAPVYVCVHNGNVDHRGLIPRSRPSLPPCVSPSAWKVSARYRVEEPFLMLLVWGLMTKTPRSHTWLKFRVHSRCHAAFYPALSRSFGHMWDLSAIAWTKSVFVSEPWK